MKAGRDSKAGFVYGGLAIGLIGLAIMGYFMLFFSMTAPGTNIVNLGLMNDRTNGMIAGGILLLAGVILFGIGQFKPGRTFQQTAPPPPPQPPANFNMPLRSAVAYALPAVPVANTSYVLWRKEVDAHTRMTFTEAQYQWGYANGVDPTSFAEFVGYVEAARAYYHAAKTLP